MKMRCTYTLKPELVAFLKQLADMNNRPLSRQLEMLIEAEKNKVEAEPAKQK